MSASERLDLHDGFLADCPARFTIEVLADTWSSVVLFALSRGPVRHGELVDVIGGVSRKMLTQTLRKLQAYGLVRRDEHPGSAIRIEYELTPLGHTLIDPIHQLTVWGREHGEEVLAALDASEERALAGTSR